MVRTDPELSALARHWVIELARGRDLVDDAITRLACWVGRPPAEMRALLAGKTLADLEPFWAALPVSHSADTVSACASFIRSLVEGKELLPEQVFERLAQRMRGNDAPELRVVVALSGLIPEQVWPAILLAQDESRADSARWLAKAIGTATALVVRLPQLLVAVAAPEAAADAYLRSEPESQALALFREGWIDIPVLDEAAVDQQIQDAQVPMEMAASAIPRVTALGADEGLVSLLSEAARGLANLHEADEASVDRARSAAERFLHELLESHPTTAGLFELNGRLDFRFGNRPAEIDLLARRLHVAVELDGSHWHMRDLDAYRRDRRKDWELQRHGYLVLRFLAEDVIGRLEEILDIILEAVRCRRQSANLTGDL